jgi:hypothetical protein
MIAADITGYLASEGHGTAGTDLFTDDMPADPDSLVVVYEYPGMASVYVHDSHAPTLEQPRIQITVRGTQYTAVSTKAEAVHAALLGIANMTINGVRYGHIRHLQDGWLKTRDERNRHIWQRNYQVIREAIVQSI